MSEKAIRDIRIIVEDENSLYVPYSPESEFKDEVKSYIRLKTKEASFESGIRLIVISPSAVDEDRFRAAVKSWIRDEKAELAREEKITRRILISMLVVASLFIVLSLYLSKYNNVFSYTIIPVLGSVALGKAAGMCIMEVPVNMAKKHLINEIEKYSTVVFERTEV